MASFHEHKRECFAAAWAPLTRDTFLSSSWDGTVKIWDFLDASLLRTIWFKEPITHMCADTLSRAHLFVATSVSKPDKKSEFVFPRCCTALSDT